MPRKRFDARERAIAKAEARPTPAAEGKALLDPKDLRAAIVAMKNRDRSPLEQTICLLDQEPVVL